MVESGQTQIRPVDFESRLHPRLPVEVVECQELLARVDPEYLATPQRPSFYLFVLMSGSGGSHTVDFTEIPAQSRRLILIRPGQVQVFDTNNDLDATMVLSQPATSSSHSWFPGHVSYCDLDDGAMATAESLIAALRGEQARFDGDQRTSRLMIALFDALLALYDKADADTTEGRLPDVYLAYRNAIETDLTHRHDVIDYAGHLGYSARTITRACHKATGQTAKQVLTERLVLEAKRLLVHTDTPAATISTQLGFSEPTNFTKFFTRATSQTPSVFRNLYRRPA
jgi:AraC-like DNA-binding protein